MNALLVNCRIEITDPDWWKGRMVMLGGASAPALTRLEAGMPSTPEVSQVPSARRAMWPKEIPFEVKARVCPGAVMSRAARRSAVIWRASISMNPEPNIPIVARELKDCRSTGDPRSSSAPRSGMRSV